MSGVAGHSGSNSGRIGYNTGQWKLIETKNLVDAGNNSVVHFTTASGMKPQTFIRYRLIGSGVQIAGSTDEAEFGLRWSCVAGASAGNSDNNYYAVRWAAGHNESVGSGELGGDTDNGQSEIRICYFNNATQTAGLSQFTIEGENVGVSDPGGGTDRHGFYCHSIGYVHYTSRGGYGMCVSGGISNHSEAVITATGGELTCISLMNDVNAFDKGTVRLYGLIK